MNIEFINFKTVNSTKEEEIMPICSNCNTNLFVIETSQENFTYSFSDPVKTYKCKVCKGIICSLTMR